MNYLLFQLYSPLTSWGDLAVGTRRPSQRHPSKSAVLGLVAAALGLERQDSRQTELFLDFKLGVKLLRAGDPVVDYHTIQVRSKETKKRFYNRKQELDLPRNKLNTILSSRDYYQDQLSIVALWSENSSPVFSLEEIRTALEKPKFHLYLGRKSCPLALPLAPEIIMASTLKGAFDQAKFNVEKKILSYFVNQEEFYFWESTQAAGMEPAQIVDRYDQVLSRERWQFGSRKEYQAGQIISGKEND